MAEEEFVSDKKDSESMCWAVSAVASVVRDCSGQFMPPVLPCMTWYVLNCYGTYVLSIVYC